MKTIIVCTDFSPNANNAVHYAAALAREAKARLVLFHFFDRPIPATDLQGIFPASFLDRAEKEREQKLLDIKRTLVDTFHIEVAYVLRSFDLPIDLEGVFHQEKAECVVMGTQGQSALVNAIIGNVTAGAIRRGKLPLLVVPEGAIYRPVKKILFPCDNHDIQHQDTIRPLRYLADTFDAYIEVLTLFDLEKTPALVPAGRINPEKDNLETLLANTRHGYAYENEDAIEKGILSEVTRTNADLLAMIPHHHSFLSGLLNQSETQRIISSIKIPLLVLGERVQPAA